jgi:hypothetical protein
VPLVSALVGIEHDDAVVAAVGDEYLVGGRVIGDRRRAVHSKATKRA